MIESPRPWPWADFLFYTLLDLIVDAYFPLLAEMEDDIGTVEDRLLGKGSVININRLLALKRSLVRIRRAVSPQREGFQPAHAPPFPMYPPGVSRLLP